MKSSRVFLFLAWVTYLPPYMDEGINQYWDTLPNRRDQRRRQITGTYDSEGREQERKRRTFLELWLLQLIAAARPFAAQVSPPNFLPLKARPPAEGYKGFLKKQKLE